jgi:hypothetical protein
MAVVYDTFSNVAAGTGDLSWTHTPVGTPRGVLVYIIYASTTNQVSSVTYGGVAMSEVSSSPMVKPSGEVGTVHGYFLGSGIPTGAQTVSVTVSGSTSKRAGCYTITADRPTYVVDTSTLRADSQANPSVTVSISVTSFVSMGFLSGQDTASGISPNLGWAASLEDAVLSYSRGWYKFDTYPSADIACGWTQTADDAIALAVAISEDLINSEVNIFDSSYSREGNSYGLDIERTGPLDLNIGILGGLNDYVFADDDTKNHTLDISCSINILETSDPKENLSLLIPEYHVIVADMSIPIEYIFILNTTLGNINIINERVLPIEDISISIGLPSGYQNYVYSLTTLETVYGVNLSNIEEVIGI